MKNIQIDAFSGCACPITLICNQHVIGGATGCFWRRGSRTYLISNWHVFSGREPTSGQPKNSQGAVPDMLQVTGASKQDPNQIFQITMPVSNANGAAIWKQHRVFGQKADLAVMDVSQALDGVASTITGLEAIVCLNEVRQVDDMRALIGQDVFVLGFPLGIMKTGVFPIWKRGSIATEPDFPVNGMPCFLVDTATREGMSGAPVITRSENGYQKQNGDTVIGFTATQVIGIYSGRYVAELGEAQLGIVWKSEMIDQIIDDPAPGDYVLT